MRCGDCGAQLVRVPGLEKQWIHPEGKPCQPIVMITPKDVPIFRYVVTEPDGTERPETPEEQVEREAQHALIRKRLFGDEA